MMNVLINTKICDNVQECGGISACPNKAIYWDKKSKSIKIENSKCANCGLCENACPVEAIRVAKNEKEYNQIKKEIKEDNRTISDLFVDRYGAMPIGTDFLVLKEGFKSFENSDNLAVLELFNKNSIQCLLRSIPISELFYKSNLRYGKLEVQNNLLLNKFDVKNLPCLLFFKDGKLIGKIEGYFDESKKEEIKIKIKEIMK